MSDVTQAGPQAQPFLYDLPRPPPQDRQPQDRPPQEWPSRDWQPQDRPSQTGSPLSRLVTALYRIRRLRPLVRRLCLRLEGGQVRSDTLRAILARFHGVAVGRYSYGAILTPGVLPRGTRVGAYCSVGGELIVRRRDHPVDRPGLHAFFITRPSAWWLPTRSRLSRTTRSRSGTTSGSATG